MTSADARAASFPRITFDHYHYHWFIPSLPFRSARTSRTPCSASATWTATWFARACTTRPERSDRARTRTTDTSSSQSHLEVSRFPKNRFHNRFVYLIKTANESESKLICYILLQTPQVIPPPPPLHPGERITQLTSRNSVNEEKKAASFIPYITNLQQPVDVKVRARKGKDTTLVHRKEGQQQWTKNVE